MRLTRIALWALIGAVTGCSTTSVEPLPMLPEGPSYLRVPHPQGYDLSEARVLFRDAHAPDAEKLKSCDAEFQKLRKVVTIPDDFEKGVRELVQRDPEAYHWCFYSKTVELYDRLQTPESGIRDRQRMVLEAYEFLAPVAKAFRIEFSDTRYQRYAVVRYREISPWVFYRQVDLTPQSTSDLLVGVGQPFGAVRAPAEQNGSTILEKYGLSKTAPPIEAAPTEVPK